MAISESQASYDIRLKRSIFTHLDNGDALTKIMQQIIHTIRVALMTDRQTDTPRMHSKTGLTIMANAAANAGDDGHFYNGNVLHTTDN